jgi:hypothetical protein
MKKSVVTRMSLLSDKDVETYRLKSRSDDNDKMSCYRQFNRGFNFYKEIYMKYLILCYNINQEGSQGLTSPNL